MIRLCIVGNWFEKVSIVTSQNLLPRNDIFPMWLVLERNEWLLIPYAKSNIYICLTRLTEITIKIRNVTFDLRANVYMYMKKHVKKREKIVLGSKTNSEDKKSTWITNVFLQVIINRFAGYFSLKSSEWFPSILSVDAWYRGNKTTNTAIKENWNKVIDIVLFSSYS